MRDPNYPFPLQRTLVEAAKLFFNFCVGECEFIEKVNFFVFFHKNLYCCCCLFFLWERECFGDYLWFFPSPSLLRFLHHFIGKIFCLFFPNCLVTKNQIHFISQFFSLHYWSFFLYILFWTFFIFYILIFFKKYNFSVNLISRINQ